jgi:hypothetical protein
MALMSSKLGNHTFPSVDLAMAEFFNMFNQVNFRNPDPNMIDGPGAFGTIRALPGRVIQFGLKML